MLGLLFLLATVGKKIAPVLADNIILQIPFYREMMLAQDNYINMHRLSLLARSGVRMEEALKSTYENCKAGALREDFNNALTALKKGQKWASGMKMLHPTDRAALMLASDREQIAENLENIADQYQALYIQRVELFAPVMQVAAALSMTLAGIVLFGVSILPMLQVSARLATKV
jgi:general secretion pathway protein F